MQNDEIPEGIGVIPSIAMTALIIMGIYFSLNPPVEALPNPTNASFVGQSSTLLPHQVSLHWHADFHGAYRAAVSSCSITKKTRPPSRATTPLPRAMLRRTRMLSDVCPPWFTMSMALLHQLVRHFFAPLHDHPLGVHCASPILTFPRR